MKSGRFENSPLRSLLRDQKITEELTSRFDELTRAITEGNEARRSAGQMLVRERAAPGERFGRLLEDRQVPQDYFGMTEAIVLTTGRPALLIQGGRWQEPRLSKVKERLDNASRPLMTTIPKVARVELLNHPNFDYIGTAWMVDQDVMITNRHVASIFARQENGRILFRTTPFGVSLRAQVDFNEEHQSPDPPFEVPIEEVLFIEKDAEFLPDMALIRVQGLETLPEPVELAGINPEPNEEVAVIGYPARDSRNDPSVMDSIFKGIYEVKRLSPGRVSGVRPDRFIMTHDCTTLGGNSGSVVFSLASGKAVGLHYAGSYLENNFAVTSETVREKLAQLNRTSTILLSQPTIDEAPTVGELSTRAGYDPGFLGQDVTLPVATDQLSGEIAPVVGREDGLLHYAHFSIAVLQERRIALFTACNIDGGKLFNIRRGSDSWRLDPRLDRDFQAGNELYRNNPLDRGHLVRRLDPGWGESREEAEMAVEDTFFYTNAAPQHSGLNQRSWLNLEDYVLDHAATHDLKVSVFTGPVFNECDGEYRETRIPREYWKVVAVINSFTGNLSTTGYLLSQSDLIGDLEFVYGAFNTYQVPVKVIEKKSGLSFGNLSNFDPLSEVETFAIRVIQHPGDLIL